MSTKEILNIKLHIWNFLKMSKRKYTQINKTIMQYNYKFLSKSLKA